MVKKIDFNDLKLSLIALFSSSSIFLWFYIPSVTKKKISFIFFSRVFV